MKERERNRQEVGCSYEGTEMYMAVMAATAGAPLVPQFDEMLD